MVAYRAALVSSGLEAPELFAMFLCCFQGFLFDISCLAWQGWKNSIFS